MKITISGMFVLVALCANSFADERSSVAKAEEVEQVQLWENRLRESSTMSAPEKINYLQLGLRNMGWRKSFAGHGPSVDSIYSEIQQTLLAIPGHAQYFADEIEREQKKVEQYPTNTGPRVSYDFDRSMYFRTLCHLPSPETIKVLGHFLYDDKDTPIPLVSRNSDWGRNPQANSWAATATIMDIGLRDAPVSRQHGLEDNPETLAAARDWWEEIKSGKRTFSFVGQKVEYRFKPDGTWETIALVSPPDDGPKAPKIENVDRKHPAESRTSNWISEHSSSWAWIIGGAMALLAIVVWIGAKRR